VRIVDVLSPSSPAWLNPQQSTAPFCALPQVCLYPAEIDVNFTGVETAVGFARKVVVLSPS
jgi:hypothetical protein